jgi:hypothetical protein
VVLHFRFNFDKESHYGELVREFRFTLYIGLHMSRGSLVRVTDYGLEDRGSITDRGFSSSLCDQTGSGAHPVSCPMGTEGSFPRGKARPGRDSDHSPPSSAEVKYE